MRTRNVVILSIILLLGWFLTGSRSDVLYPPPASSPYKLPWRGGVERLCSQGNRSFATHRGFYEFSWDFFMGVGTDVLAARGGAVVEVVDDLEYPSFEHGNRVVIKHMDGTLATYAHLKYHGTLVKLGELVRQGQHIGYSGMTGRTLYPHLHFHVTDAQNTETIPVTFEDVPTGPPLAARFYTSGNMK